MPFVSRKTVLIWSLAAVAGLLLAAGLVWSGVYNVAADDVHARPTYALLRAVRDRSITVRARDLHPPPDLGDAALVRQGAGNYDAMCTGCHLRPGMQPTELSRGLYPAPPALSAARQAGPAHDFWVIKHGIKATGMPAWGASMEDRYIWGMVAFLQELPNLDAGEYQAMVAASGGHSHGGNETMPHVSNGRDAAALQQPAQSQPHAHPPGTPPDHHSAPVRTPAPGDSSHAHAPGSPPHGDGAAPKAVAGTGAAAAAPVAKPTPTGKAESEEASEGTQTVEESHENHDHHH